VVLYDTLAPDLLTAVKVFFFFYFITVKPRVE